jgi:hypothetical protein
MGKLPFFLPPFARKFNLPMVSISRGTSLLREAKAFTLPNWRNEFLCKLHAKELGSVKIKKESVGEIGWVDVMNCRVSGTEYFLV